MCIILLKIILNVLFFIANYIALYLYYKCSVSIDKNIFQKKPKLINKFINIQGTYELVARNKEGEEQAQIVELTEEQVKLSLQAQDESAEKKGTQINAFIKYHDQFLWIKQLRKSRRINYYHD